MKSGSGDDLFDELDDEAEEEEKSGDVDVELESERANEIETEATPTRDSTDAPYLLRRTSVKDKRKTVGFSLQKSTRQLEDDVLPQVKNDLGVEELPVTDLREAAYLAGLQNPELLEEILLEWGYEHRQ